MQQINDTEKLVTPFDERERQALIRIKETQELIEQNRRLTKNVREVIARAEMAAPPWQVRLVAKRLRTATPAPG
ncbi:hypothetical protein [Mesorhizobium carmichaelinearum]|uniref:hypothetical protein n=1 Tax=Mesorhizobium carmichaelinearum TaxID=1208188 RepID=UPI00117E900F|nr:hypothetical protein [Mesorhizobium carmichaelinearum]